jgi:inorganic pyrophosphatase/exopolyphosphatase
LKSLLLLKKLRNSLLDLFYQRRGLQQLSDAGIVAILDHHALPGVQSPNQMFTGRFLST